MFLFSCISICVSLFCCNIAYMFLSPSFNDYLLFVFLMCWLPFHSVLHLCLFCRDVKYFFVGNDVSIFSKYSAIFQCVFAEKHFLASANFVVGLNPKHMQFMKSAGARCNKYVFVLAFSPTRWAPSGILTFSLLSNPLRRN